MATYPLDVLRSIFLPKNVRKTRDNLYDSSTTLAPHADAIPVYQVVSDILEYENITSPAVTNTPNPNDVSLTVGTSITAIPAATITTAGVMSSSDKTNLASLITLTGVPANSTNLGSFTGPLIPPNSTIKQAFQALSDAFSLTADGNGIYSGSGVIPPHTHATVTTNSAFVINYANNNAALTIADSASSSTLLSKNNSNFIQVSNVGTTITGFSSSLNFNAAEVIAIAPAGGIKYNANYHTTYTNRSLVDKEYVDNKSLPIPNGPGSVLYSNGTNWQQAYPIRYDINSNSSVVTLPHIPVTLLPVEVYVNGVLKRPVDDYTILSNQVSFTIPIIIDDNITFKYYAP